MLSWGHGSFPCIYTRFDHYLVEIIPNYTGVRKMLSSLKHDAMVEIKRSVHLQRWFQLCSLQRGGGESPCPAGNRMRYMELLVQAEYTPETEQRNAWDIQQWLRIKTEMVESCQSNPRYFTQVLLHSSRELLQLTLCLIMENTPIRNL